MNYEHYTLHDPAEESELPLKFDEAAPCIGKRVLTCHLTAENETELKFIWSGNTWAFRDAMDEAGVKGPYSMRSLREAVLYARACIPRLLR